MPRIHDGERQIVDKAKIREEYLTNPHYAFTRFLRENGYDPTASREFPARALQQEWLRQQVEFQEDDLVPLALDAKKYVGLERVKFPKNWNAKAEGAAQLADFLLRKEMQKASHDIQNEKAIREGTITAQSDLDGAKLLQIVRAQREIQELQLKALLVPSADAYAASIPIKAPDAESVNEVAEKERLNDIEYGLMGGGTLTSDKMTQILNQWIDQQKPNPNPDEPKPEDQALTPFGEDE